MGNVLNINKKSFLMTTSIGYAALMVLLAVLFFSGTVLAAFPLAGVGGFVVAAAEIEGQGFQLVPAIGETQARSLWPQGAVTLNSVKIKELNLSKELNVSNELGNFGIHKVRIEITTTGDVEGQGVRMNISGMVADLAEFNNMEVKERRSDNPLNVLGLQADSMKLTNPELNAHSLTTNSIGLPGMKLKIIAYDQNGNYVGGDFDRD